VIDKLDKRGLDLEKDCRVIAATQWAFPSQYSRNCAIQAAAYRMEIMFTVNVISHFAGP
jgi:hypothetical protein